MSLTEEQKHQRQELLWERIAKAVDSAVLIEWDGCHKIYIHTFELPEYRLACAITAEESSPEIM
ncbi:hypothetical protein, partial [Glutamicibacter ardleyensis]|uniref:hypothetical protein n=1 Tax=Glutamicibacter ardleyensis TaxID=225894 RepID=UPI003FCF2429